MRARTRLTFSRRKKLPATIRAAALTATAAVLLGAQTVAIYSEFQRIDPFGQIVAADRGQRPREILSPAAPRNAFASFHVAVTAPPGTNYFLFVVTNPLNACRVALYQERFVNHGDKWIPDGLVEVRRLPHFAAMPDPSQQIPGQNTRVYLLDVWIPPDARPPGFRLEVQLKVGDWMVAPMEVRVLPVEVPAPSGTPGKVVRALPPIEQGADASALAPLRDYFSAQAESAEMETPTVRGIIRRNAIQDMALAASLDKEPIRKLWQSLENPFLPRLAGAEWYLRIRDYIYRQSNR